MLKCKEVTGLCSQAMERPLRLGERLALRMHLTMCSGCTNYRKQIVTLRRAMQAYAEGEAIASDANGPDRTR